MRKETIDKYPTTRHDPDEVSDFHSGRTRPLPTGGCKAGKPDEGVDGRRPSNC
jgi:hypothetical protein